MSSYEDAMSMLRGKDPSLWTVAEVGVWLDAIGMSKFKARFAQDAISGDALLYLTEQDLETLGIVSLGHRKKVMLNIQRLLDGGGADSGDGSSDTQSEKSFSSQPSTSSASQSGKAFITFKCSYHKKKKLIKIDTPGSIAALRRALKNEYGLNMSAKFVDPDGDKFALNKDKDLRSIVDTYRQPLTLELRKKKSRSSKKTSKMSSVSYSMLDTLVDGCIVIDAGGKIIFFNKSAEKMWGYDRSEVVDGNVKRLMNDNDAGKHDGYLTRYLSTKDPHIIGKGRKVMAKRKDGSEMALHLAVSENIEGRTITFTGVCKQIDSLESESAGNEQMDILDNLLDPAVVIDEKGRIQFINRAAQRAFGFNITEVVGRNVKLLMPYQYRREHDQYLKNYLETGVKKVIDKTRDVLAQAKDGTIFPVNLALTETKTATRHTFTGILRRLADKDADAEEFGNEDEEGSPLDQHREMLDSLGVAAVVIDADARIQVWTKSAEKMLGYKDTEVLGRNVKMMVPTEVAPKHDAYVKKYLETGKSSVIGIGRKLQAKQKNGQLKSVHLAVSERELPNGQRIFTGILQAL